MKSPIDVAPLYSTLSLSSKYRFHIFLMCKESGVRSLQFKKGVFLFYSPIFTVRNKNNLSTI